jgi:hypothetical protein
LRSTTHEKTSPHYGAFVSEVWKNIHKELGPKATITAVQPEIKSRWAALSKEEGRTPVPVVR